MKNGVCFLAILLIPSADAPTDHVASRWTDQCRRDCEGPRRSLEFALDGGHRQPREDDR